LLLKLKENSFFTSVATLASGTVIAQLIAILVSPIITRLYTPADMGILASFLAITGILGIIATGTYDQAIILPEDETDARALVFLSGSISIVFGLAVTIVFFSFYEPLVSVFNLQYIPRIWVYGIGIVVVLIGFDAILNRLATRRRQFKILASTTVLQQVGTNGTKIGAGVFGAGGANGLLFAMILGQLIRGIRLLFAQSDFLFDKEKFPDFGRIKTVARRYKKFPLVASWSSLLNSASAQLPVIMFASFFSVDVAGHYLLSHRILRLPMGIIGQNVGQVFLERASKVRNDFAELQKKTFSIYKKLLLIGTIIMSFVLFYGDILFPFVFGHEWLIAGQFAQWISIWLVFQFMASPLSSIYIALEKQKELLVFNVCTFILRFSVIFLAYIRNFTDLKMIACFSILGAILYFFLAVRILCILQCQLQQIFKSFFLILVPIFVIQYFLSFFVRSLLGVNLWMINFGVGNI